MKILYFSFLLFLLIENSQSQGFCPSIIVSYNVTGSKCSGTGNFNIFHNSTAQTLLVSQSNTTLINIADAKLCAQLEFLDPGGTSSCILYNTSVAGNFTIKLVLCDSPNISFSSIGPIFYNASGLSTNIGKCDNTILPCSLTVPSFLKFLPKLNKSFPSSKLSIDDYCTDLTPPPPPQAIAPPIPVINCNDTNNSFYINQTCRIQNVTDPTVITQLINDTSSQIQDAIKAGSLNSSSIHDAGAFIYNTVKVVPSLNTEGAHSILDIINSIAIQPLHTLQGSNSITNNSLLWYPSVLPIIVAKTNADLSYNKDGSNLLLHSFSLSGTFCANSNSNFGNSHEVCYSSTSQVPSGSKDAEFCTSFNPSSLCNNASKAYLTMWKSLSFFALVKNNSLGIKTGVIEKPASTTTEKKQSNHGFLWSWLASTSDNSAPQSSTPNQPLTFDTADACSSGVYFKNSYSSNAGGVDANGIPSATGSTVWVKRRSDENDLHVSKFKIASFVADSFVDGGAEVQKNDKHYTAECYQGTCTLLVDGNPTEPLVCSSGAKTTQAVIGGIGIFIAVIGIFGYFFKSKTIPIISTIASVVFNIFNDKNLPKRLKFFAYCYNATFLLYSLYLLLFAEQQITNTSKGMCTAFAVVGYILYISAVFLSVIMIIITLEALGCWKPMIRKGLYIFTGNQKIYVPFIYSYGIPLLLTAIFAAALTSFFKRNDGYCWIRPDYAFLALWFPIILLLFTIPLYIILIARRWPNASISKRIYSPLTISDDLTDYEASKKKRKAREKAENKKDKKNNEDSIERGGVDDIDGGDEADDGKVVLTNQTLARLIIPQIFLAIPLIAENLALYYAKLTGWHYLFFLTQAFQLIALHGISYIDKISYVRTGWNWIKGKFMKKSPKKTENDEEVAVVEKPKKPPRGQKRQNTLPNDIEDFEPVTLARDSEIQKPRTEMLRMTRRPNEDSEDDGNGNEVITRESELSGEEEEESKTSSISIESLTPKTNKLKDDAIISKDEQRHAGAHDLGDDIASTISLKSYTPEAALETEIPVKVHILRLDSNMLPDVPFIREPVDEWLQDHNEKGLQTQPGGDWHHLDEHGIQLRFSDIPSGSRSSHSSSNHSHEKEELSESDSDGEEKLVEEVVSNPNLASQTYSDDATQIIDSLPDIEQISKDNHIPSSYIPYIGEAVSDDSSLEEEMVKQVLHPNLQPQIHQDDATMIIDSLPPVEEISNFEPDYSEMYHLDKNPVHSLSPSDHIPLDIPFIRESIDTALAQGKTPSYIPLDPRRPSIISVHQDEIVEKVKEAPSSGLPPDKGILPESQQLPTYEINMDDLYTFDRHGLHYLSPSEGELPVDCPFIRNPVEEDLQRSRAPSYIPRLFGHQHDETTEILVYQKQMEEIELSQNIHQHHHHHDETEKHVHHHHHGEHESLKMEPTKMVVHEQQSIGKGSDLSGYPEVIRNILGHHHHHHQHDETTEILVYQKQMEEIELPKQNFSPQIFYSQHSIGATSEASTSIYQTPPETPLANLSPLHYRMPSDNVSMATQYYQTPPETPFQAYQMSHQHPLSTHDIHHHHHHRRGSSGSESEFPFFKFKTLRNEDLVGPENVIHSDSTSLAEED